ncbi:YdcF family protein [Mycolicibacterium cosmeticum]|uniref:YdcF family protein n=1 Tax=Mycolicibacterium cosmeticum TaxID=258533 RepID=UPI003204F3DB
MTAEMLTGRAYTAAAVLWDYTACRDDGTPTDIAIVLGCHDRAVPAHAAELFSQGRFPWLIMTGAPRKEIPEGEAICFAREAYRAGVCPPRVFIEPTATNTEENITASRKLANQRHLPSTTATLVTRPYHQRRAIMTARRHWPEIQWSTSAKPEDIGTYCQRLGDTERVLNNLVGEVQRIEAYSKRGMLDNRVTLPATVAAAVKVLNAEGYPGRPFP